MSETRHWELREQLDATDGERTFIEVVDESGDVVCDDCAFYPMAVTRENAELIIKAVNAYDALLEACKSAYYLPDVWINDPDGEAEKAEKAEIKQELEKALALAEPSPRDWPMSDEDVIRAEL